MPTLDKLDSDEAIQTFAEEVANIALSNDRRSETSNRGIPLTTQGINDWLKGSAQLSDAERAKRAASLRGE